MKQLISKTIVTCLAIVLLGRGLLVGARKITRATRQNYQHACNRVDGVVIRYQNRFVQNQFPLIRLIKQSKRALTIRRIYYET